MPPDPQLWFTLDGLECEKYRIAGDDSPFGWVAGRLIPDIILRAMDGTVSSCSHGGLKEAVATPTATVEARRAHKWFQVIELEQRKP